MLIDCDWSGNQKGEQDILSVLSCHVVPHVFGNSSRTACHGNLTMLTNFLFAVQLLFATSMWH